MALTSLQTIVDRAESIGIDHRGVVATTVTRNQRVLTAERNTYKPWSFTITPSNGYVWDASNRELVAALEQKDRWDEHEISLGNNANLSWLTSYGGELTTGQQADMTIASVGNKSFVLNLGSTVQALGSTTVLFRAGDIIQPANSRYPYKVATTVTRGSGTTRTVHVHRGVIQDQTFSGQTLKIGSACTWRVVVTGLPRYVIVPGRLIEWQGEFEAVEKIL